MKGGFDSLRLRGGGGGGVGMEELERIFLGEEGDGCVRGELRVVGLHSGPEGGKTYKSNFIESHIGSYFQFL